MPIATKYLFIVSMDVAKEKEALFNEVYDTEHVPLLMKVPGVKAVKDSPKRAEAFKAIAARHGVKVHHVLWTLGQYDLITIVEADDDIAATALGLSMAALGNVQGQTLRAFDAGDMAKIIAKMA